MELTLLGSDAVYCLFCGFGKEITFLEYYWGGSGEQQTLFKICYKHLYFNPYNNPEK